MAFDTDKTAQLTHLKPDRRRYKKSINSMGADESKEKARKEYVARALLKVGKEKPNSKIPATTQIRIFFKNRKN